MLDVTRDTIANSISDYESVTETIFVCFILFQALILFFFRQKLIGMMREDIFQSRGNSYLIYDEYRYPELDPRGVLRGEQRVRREVNQEAKGLIRIIIK